LIVACSYNFQEATQYTPDLIKAGISLLNKIYKPGYYYQKAGILLTEIIPQGKEQESLFNLDHLQYKNPKKDLVIQKVDEINSLFGNNTLIFGSSGIKKEWKIKSEKRSDRYTTCFNEILTIKI
jgi:DNA polymerase V